MSVRFSQFWTALWFAIFTIVVGIIYYRWYPLYSGIMLAVGTILIGFVIYKLLIRKQPVKGVGDIEDAQIFTKRKASA